MTSRASHRAVIWVMAAALIIGFLGATSATAAGSHGCCAREAGCPEDMQQCQWMAPAGCCQEPLPVAGSSIDPKPATKAALLATASALQMRRTTAGRASPPPSAQRALCASVVLRL